MLRVHQIANAANAKAYYTTSDYFLDTPGEWIGKGAELLGLSGRCDQKHFDALCDNLNPMSGRPLTVLIREGKIELLAYGIDWTEYVNCGMEPIECDRIIMNAVDGKPQKQWLEPIANEGQWIAEKHAKMHEETDKIRRSIARRDSRFGPTLAQLLEGFASPEPSCVDIEHGRER